MKTPANHLDHIMQNAAVIAVGLPWDHPMVKGKFGDEIANAVREGLKKMVVDMKDLGYDYKQFFLGPEQGMTPLIDELKGKNWDGVLVGFGVRGNPDLTVFFEQIVNTAREHAPAAKLLFNSSPESTVDAVKRWFPTA